MADFKTWTHENLVKFAEEANAKMIQQNEYNEKLQLQLKDSEAAYKKLFDVFMESHGIS
jgi:hypothetical protein